MNYVASWWLPGGNLQTIWPALYARRVAGAPVCYRRERWDTPDGDFIDVDFGAWPCVADAPCVVLFHGLEGSSRSHYAEAFAGFARAQGMAFAVPHFRGCSGQINLAPRAYHSGDFEEIDWILRRLREQQRARGGGALVAVGVSMGGNVLMRWAEEMGTQAGDVAGALAAVSAPLDLAASGHAIGRGFNRQVYTRMFLRTMVPKALRKLAQHPGLFSRERLLAVRDLYEFDNVFTAPLHGFRGTDDYWHRASARPQLRRIRIPALLLNAHNDPFVPATSLPRADEVSASVTLWQCMQGGHVGFAQGRCPPGDAHFIPQAVGGWLASRVGAIVTL